MIVDYFKYNLFPRLHTFHVGYTELDINVSTIDQFTDYETITDIVYRDEDQVQCKLTNPQHEKYNIMVGYADSGALCFIKGISLDISEYEVHSVQFNVVKVASGTKIDFDIHEELTYLPHVHDKMPTHVEAIQKFSEYINELIDDEIDFSKGKIVKRSWFPTLTNNQVRVGLSAQTIESQRGVYGVNFKYEMMPSEIIPLIDNEDFQLNPGNYNFTYRGSTICYRESSNRYHLIRDGVDQIFNTPITLINEHYAVAHNSVIYQWEGVESKWVALNERCNLVVYRAAFKMSNGLILRIL